MNSPNRRMLTQEEAAEWLGTTVRQLERFRVNGGGPAYCRLSPRAIRYAVQDLERWTASRTFEHRAGELSSQSRAA
jgi:hypothetical protein